MEQIETACRRPSSDSHYINASKIPFVRTTKGEQICAKDESGHLQVYLNNPDVARYKIDNKFITNDTIRSFYANALRIPEYNAAQEVIEKILPYYQTKTVQRTIEENIADLKIIKDAIYENRSVKDLLSDKYLITNGREWFTPGEIYIQNKNARSGLSLMHDILEINYLAESYFDDTVMSISLDESFFESIGCNTGLREIRVTNSTYLDAVRKYIGIDKISALKNRIFSKTYISDKFNWDFCYEGFGILFKNMSFDKSRAIARFLNANHTKFDIQGTIVAANDRNFAGNYADSMSAYSMIGIYLSFEKWIYVNGDDKPKRPIDVDISDLRPEYKEAKHIIGMLPFKEINNALKKCLSEIIQNEDDRKLIENALRDPEKVVSIVKAQAEKEARIAKHKPKSVTELIAEGDRNQNGRKKSDDDFEVNPISEPAIRRREESLEKELEESLGHKTAVARGIKFTRRTSNKEERQFLLSEYSGHCQICKRQIIKYNGEEYFEAINIIKFSETYSEYEASGRLGWNSLCLCPNCAAEYNYCSKKISTLHEQVMNTEVIPGSDVPIEIQIELPEGQNRVIHYSPRHFIALREAFRTLSNK